MQAFIMYLNKIPTNIIGLIIIAIVVIPTAILSDSNFDSSKLSTNILSLCNVSGQNYGTATLRLDIIKSGTYTIWEHVESPIPISYSVIPQLYNPFFVSIDNQHCYMVGGVHNMPVDTWVWLNYLDGNTYYYLKLNLSSGYHIVSMAGTNVSIDRVIAVSGNCIPKGNGLNCLPHESQTFDSSSGNVK